MSDLIGKTLGPYRILEQIGVGGMATVYKAYQPSMDRDVAIKILPHYLSQDAEFAKRFQREARAIAKLEHAHILPVYDYGEHEDITYIAMRYVQAGTLKERIAQGPLPLDEINRLISQIGAALDYAHRIGIIHRDVKPSNVLIDDQGNTYLTDFGLARIMESSQQLTASGVGVGTPAYMSPEQGQGVKVDHRSDIYSLGVVLYEMVTGHVPYEAETPMGVVLKHISDPLPLPRKLSPNVPEGVEKVILRALAKDPAHRFQTAREMVEALNIAVRKAAPPELAQPVAVEAVPSGASISFVTRVERVWEKPRGKFALVGGTVIVLVALGLLLSQLPGRVQIAAPGVTATAIIGRTATQVGGVAQVATPSRLRPTATASPFPVPVPLTEGKVLILCENVKPAQICVQDVSTGQITPITHDLNFKGVVGSFSWSPDGRQIAFSAAQTDSAPQKLYLIQADGTGLKPLTSGDSNDHEAAWSPDGQWIAFHRDCSLTLIRPDGSDLRRVLPSNPNQFCAEAPAWSPDSKRFALLNFSKTDTEIWVVNADGSEPRMIFAFGKPFDGGNVVWSPDGQWILCHWNKRGEYGHWLVPADGQGEPQALASYPVPDWWHTGFWPQWGRSRAALATQCRIAYVEDTGDIIVQNCDGSGLRQITFLRSILGLGRWPLSWSPDGKYIVFQSTHERQPGNDPSLYLIQADGSNLTRLTFGDHHDKFPAWSPDGRRIAFHRNCDLVTISPDGSDEQVIVHGNDVCPNTISWSPDSQQIAFVSWHDPFPENLKFVAYVVNSDGTNLRKLGKFEGGMVPTWSPDGKQIGVEDMGNRENAYLLNPDGSGEPMKVSSIPDSWHAWHWPQWDKVQTPSPDAMAEQARAFAEPILQAIADRKPDFADDFSTAGKGWGIGGEPKEGSAIQGGVARLRVNDGSASLGNEALNRKDFVLQVDARVAEGDKATQLIVNFHNLSGEYWFYLVVNSAGNTWLVDKRLAGQQPNLAGGQGNVSPYGETTRIMIVARGPRAAIYLNGTPAAYFEDADFDTSGGTGLFCQSLGQAVCEFDSVKFWNLNNVPGLP